MHRYLSVKAFPYSSCLKFTNLPKAFTFNYYVNFFIFDYNSNNSQVVNRELQLDGIMASNKNNNEFIVTNIFIRY